MDVVPAAALQSGVLQWAGGGVATGLCLLLVFHFFPGTPGVPYERRTPFSDALDARHAADDAAGAAAPAASGAEAPTEAESASGAASGPSVGRSLFPWLFEDVDADGAEAPATGGAADLSGDESASDGAGETKQPSSSATAHERLAAARARKEALLRRIEDEIAPSGGSGGRGPVGSAAHETEPASREARALEAVDRASERAERARRYESMKAMLGLTDEKIRLAVEMAERGERVPKSRAQHAVETLDRLVWAGLLAALVYFLWRDYGLNVFAWIAAALPTEAELVRASWARLSGAAAAVADRAAALADGGGGGHGWGRLGGHGQDL
jgi:hypothetical protein